ncbi:RNA polymerase sigma factor [Luteimonas sp. BDR2-5]|uniref:RNA polymerase sigma factor n=1 Tax=Proluteimonas luteida TaxID=2878685 RepID=UPI001E503759|nr:RNA polymerase sigma factor [Luteimonas sp. BDR2-5]MCD9028941.1 RNA polymerase sigma factor [Luteimonas sp. BDR2-5]
MSAPPPQAESAAATERPEPATLEAFLGSVERRAFRFAELGLRNRDDALDAVQDAMVRMLGYRDRPAGEWTPLFWTVLRSRIIDVQRRRKFRLSWLGDATAADGSDIDWADTGPDPSRSHDSREAWQQLSAALGRLPARQREAFTLRVLEEFDVETTARIMGCSAGSVKTHLFRAREALQTQLEEFR